MNQPLPLLRHFRRLKDPRIKRRRRHSLEAILVIAVCAVIAGANDFQEVALFGQKRLEWLRRFLDLPHGVPSHDTFERVFARLDPVVFQGCFAAWMGAWHARLTGKHLAVDGKTVCGSASPSKGFRALHLVNVWATQARLCLGMVACDAQSNEVTAIPRLLELLDLNGALVSLDAGGCQKSIAAQIIDQGGDYLMVLKQNHETLYRQVEAYFRKQLGKDFPGLSCHDKSEQGHGRQEKRFVVVAQTPEEITEREHWPELNVIGMCYSERREAGKKGSYEVRFFIGSKKAKARYYGKALRNHWGVENNLHWQLDVTFAEDATRTHQRTAQTNFAVVRRLALNLIQQDDTPLSVAKKRFAAALDADFLEEILDV